MGAGSSIELITDVGIAARGLTSLGRLAGTEVCTQLNTRGLLTTVCWRVLRGMQGMERYWWVLRGIEGY